MSVQKTYTIVIKYFKDTAGYKGERRGKDASFSAYETPALKETDLAYTELREIFLARLEHACSISQGDVSVRLVGEISEA